MLKRKDLIICIISIVMLVLAIATNVFATNTDVGALLGNSNNPVNNNLPQNINNATPNNITPNNVTPNNVNSTNTTTIPYTGVNYSVIVVIAICGISTIYAYKKIRDYNM